MVKVWAIARTSWQETIRRQVFYIVLLLTLLVALIIGSQMVLVHMAGAAGETGAAEQMRASFIGTALQVWNAAVIFLAIFLGAITLSSEVSKKTIVHVLSRPVSRSAYLAGRWLGVLMFLWAFLALGVVLSLLLAHFFNVGWTPMAWVAVLGMFVKAAFFSGIAVAMSTFMVPMLAGCVSFVLFVLLPSYAVHGLHNPAWTPRILANALYYLLPAKMPVDLLSESFSRDMIRPEYALYLEILTENSLYVIAAFAVGCWILGRRELRLR